jgi:hypothetical protein
MMLVVMASLLGAWPVRAEAGAVAGAIAVGGNADERDAAAIEQGVATATRAMGWQLPAKAVSKKERAGLLRCLEPGEPWECIPASLAAQGIRHALVVAAKRQAGEDGAPVMVLTANLVATSPRALIVRQRYCERCSEEKLREAAAEVAQRLVEELAVRTGRTLLEVKTKPSGARIVLDGESIGATDATFNTYPGAHTVILEKSGYQTETVRVEAAEGKTAEVSVELRATPGSATPETRKPATPSRTVPLALMGAGALSVVAGGVLVYVGEQDGADDKRLRPRATAVGVAAGVAGAAAVGVGLYLWLRGPRRSGPTASVSPGGVALGWRELF